MDRLSDRGIHSKTKATRVQETTIVSSIVVGGLSFRMEDVQEQARLSGLVLGNNQDESRWNFNKAGMRQRWRNALVVVNAPYNKKKEIMVVLGGHIYMGLDPDLTQAVLLLNSDGSEHKRGPKMNEGRAALAAVVCNGCVYAIGGWSRDSIERIEVSELLSSAYLNKTEKKTQWKTLQCRLSTGGSCSAAVVQKRYIVVGRTDCNGNVDILDTAQASQPFIFQGPSMNVPRIYFGMAAFGSRVYVIGGKKIIGPEELDSVEYLDLLTDSGNDERDFEESTFAPSLSWKMHNNMVLSVPRFRHSVVRVGSCLVVVGGRSDDRFSVENEGDARVRSVEVFDTKRNKVWRLPGMTKGLGEHLIAVADSNGIVYNETVVLGDELRPWQTFERLPLMDKNSAVYKRLLDGPSLRQFD